ncbi:hypothetical protein PN613_00190 [Parabacteroides distasonis]|nr:hypothetical protein [Parabacteroides distasonis]MDB8994752.1 hypothetical protein [Parabacteroides distasonis]MDB9069666.1 hypothetical protein [Parabacteroides distasonis]
MGIVKWLLENDESPWKQSSFSAK